MSWLTKLFPSRIRTSSESRRGVPEGVWTKCPECQAVLYRAELDRNLEVCPKCNYHMRISARKRLSYFLDPDTGVEIGAEIGPEDRLKFKDLKKYKDRSLDQESHIWRARRNVRIQSGRRSAKEYFSAWEFRGWFPQRTCRLRLHGA